MVRKEKKPKGGIILALIIAFLMVGSILGYVGVDRENQFKYKKMKFTRQQNGWTTVLNGKQVFFNYFPTEAEPIELSQEIITQLKNKPEIDTTSELNDTFAQEIALAQYNMILTLNDFDVFVRQGFTTENEYDLPIFT